MADESYASFQSISQQEGEGGSNFIAPLEERNVI